MGRGGQYECESCHTSPVGITPLFLAARNGNSELVKALVRAKAEVNKVGGSQCIGPLHWAAHKEYSEVALFLIEHGGDVLLKDGEGRTPLSMASLVLAEKMIGQGLNTHTWLGVGWGVGCFATVCCILHMAVVVGNLISAPPLPSPAPPMCRCCQEAQQGHHCQPAAGPGGHVG